MNITITKKMDGFIKEGVLTSQMTAGVKTAIVKIAYLAQNYAKQSILKPPKTGHIYPKQNQTGVKYQASAPGEAPANPTGRLAASIQVNVRNDLEVQLIANTEYAATLEFGGSGYFWLADAVVYIAPRPFMRPAIAKAMESAPSIIQASLK